MKRLTKKLKLDWKKIKYCTEKSAEAKLVVAKQKYYSKKNILQNGEKNTNIPLSIHYPKQNIYHAIEERMKREKQQIINGFKAKSITEKRKKRSSISDNEN